MSMSYDAINDMFRTVLEQEEMVLDLYSKIVMKVKNQEVVNALKEIMKDEARHIENAKKILEILAESV
ncbi:hypothetical protein A3K72_02945 [Candidatus Woesearchaeota archaeon RBG_13_36_6]|nr:MAG: hypothetical protein A3K72_02945 [Candidatus Woesearchaeota archaeon RBG_13_36_6]